MKPYQKYVEDNIIRIGGKSAFISELEARIKELAKQPSFYIHQLIFDCSVLRYLKSY